MGRRQKGNGRDSSYDIFVLRIMLTLDICLAEVRKNYR